MRHGLFTILFALSAAACASSRVPADRVASSQASIRAAQEVGAKDVPAAAFHLQLANEQMAVAGKMIQDGHSDRARYVLMRAEADAELALALAREDSEREDAEQAVAKVRSLQMQ